MLCLLIFFNFVIPVLAQENTITFNGTIPELTIETGMNRNVVNLSEYFTSNNTLTYKYKAGVDGIEDLVIEIGGDGRVNIEAGQSGGRSVIFIADDDITAVQSNDVKIKISGDAVVEISFSPNTDSVTLEEGKGQAFAVSGNKSIEWYIDNIKLNHTEKIYNFNGGVGLHTVRAVVEGTEKNWSVSVIAALASPPPPDQQVEAEEEGLVCGNNVKEIGESCSSCPADVKCSANTECLNGVCVPVKQQSKLILLLGLLAAAIVFVVMVVVLMRKKGIGTGIFVKIKNLLKMKKTDKTDKIDGKEQAKTEDKSEEERAEKIDEVDLNPLVIYFKSNLSRYKKEDLVNQALQQGWAQDQIDKALSKIENLGEEHDKPGEDKGPVEGKP